MPRFPTREADIASLANRVASGLREQAHDFPNPPHPADALEASVEAYEAAFDAAVAAQGAASQAVDAKAATLQRLSEQVKAVLRYAEDAVNYDGGKLKNLG